MIDPILKNKPAAPLLSVVIPVYNAEKYLGRCLDSVKASTFTAFEVICVDDGSTDRSMQILRSYAESDPRFRILTQHHQYAGAARNKGMRAASGKYIHFLDADDEILPSAYEKWIEAAEKAGAEVCECLFRNIDAGTGRLIRDPVYFPYDEDVPLVLAPGHKNTVSLLRGRVVPWNKIYLKSFLLQEEIAFDDLICAEDRSFYFEVIFKVRRIIRLRDRFILHRVGIAGSLDGSDLRSRHFEVEFRSFERIWKMAEGYPPFIQKHVLDACIGDSYSYYLRAAGTEYEDSIRRMLRAYWPVYFPVLGKDIQRSWWYMYYRIDTAADHGPYRRFLLFLGKIFLWLSRHKNLPARCIRYALKQFMNILFFAGRLRIRK